MPPPLHLDPSELDLENVLADAEAIRKINPQRHEMEQLTAVVHLDVDNGIMAGYKDVGREEFWIRGHMPDYPLMPGVLMCEAAAQLCGYFITKLNIMEGDFIGFGGLEHVRFRGKVSPGDRLILIGKVVKSNRRQTTCNVQGFVEGKMVFHGDIVGIPLNREE